MCRAYALHISFFGTLRTRLKERDVGVSRYTLSR
jgi:hypothetical protein